MAKIIQANEARAEIEDKVIQAQESLKKRRKDYMRKLIASPSFRKFVVEEILNDELSRAESIHSLPTTGSVEQTGQFAIVQLAVAQKLRAIIARIEAFNVE